MALTLEPSVESAEEALALYGTLSPQHVWKGYRSNVPIPLPPESTSTVFLVTYAWPNPVGLVGASWFSDDGDDVCGAQVTDAIITLPCPPLSDCADSDFDGTRDDACTWYDIDCFEQVCVAVPRISQADIGGSNGECQIDNACDANDRFHALNCFGNTSILGTPGYWCEDSPPSALNVDAGSPASCLLDGVCDANDAFHALNCFSNVWFDGSIGYQCGCGPQPSHPAELLPRLQKTAITLRAPAWARPGDLVAVDVHLDGSLDALRGYQLHLGVRGGTADPLELADISINTSRRDYAFANVPGIWSAFNLDVAQMVVGMDAPDGVPAQAGAYLATFTYWVPKDAAGTFTIEVRYDDSSATPQDRTFLFGRYAGLIDLTSITSAQVGVVKRHSHDLRQSD